MQNFCRYNSLKSADYSASRLKVTVENAVTVEVVGLILSGDFSNFAICCCTFLILKFILRLEDLQSFWIIKDEEGRSVSECMKERFQAEVLQIPRLFSTMHLSPLPAEVELASNAFSFLFRSNN
jgi:hypothetical protein